MTKLATTQQQTTLHIEEEGKKEKYSRAKRFEKLRSNSDVSYLNFSLSLKLKLLVKFEAGRKIPSSFPLSYIRMFRFAHNTFFIPILNRKFFLFPATLWRLFTIDEKIFSPCLNFLQFDFLIFQKSLWIVIRIVKIICCCCYIIDPFINMYYHVRDLLKL